MLNPPVQNRGRLYTEPDYPAEKTRKCCDQIYKVKGNV